MRIGINATCLNDRPSGARQRFVGLFSHLVPMMPDSEFVFFEPGDCAVAKFLDGYPNVVRKQTPIPSEGRWHRVLRGMGYWGSALRNEQFDVFEALHLPLIKPPHGKTILTIHDVRGLYVRAKLPSSLYRHVLDRALAGADLVVTVSEAMRGEILQFRPGANVRVVHNGLDAPAKPEPADAGETISHLGLPAKFILSVGHLEARKNYPALLDALGMLEKSGQGVTLVIVGNESGAGDEVRARIAANGLEARVHLLTGLSNAELACLYRAAELFIFPSLYEGFGIPLLEAMQAGVPVVASDIPVFREVLGDAGALCNPHSPDDMARVIGEVAREPERQAQMRLAGFSRINGFRYGALAARMRDCYLSL